MKLSKLELETLRKSFQNSNKKDEKLKLKLELIQALFYYDLDESLKLVNEVLKNKEYGESHFFYLRAQSLLIRIYRATIKEQEGIALGEYLVQEFTDESDISDQFIIYNSLINFYIDTTKLELASKYSHFIYEKLYDKLSKGHKAYYHSEQGRIYDIQLLGDLAMEEHQKSIELFEEIGDLNGKAKALFTIGVFLLNKKKYKDALSFFKDTLEIDFKLNRNSPRILCESQICISNCYLGMDELEKCEKYYNESLKNAQLAENQAYINRIKSTKTHFLLKKSKFEETINLANEMLSNEDFQKDSHYYYSMFNVLGESYFELKNYTKATASFEKYIGSFYDRESRKETLGEAYKKLAETYQANKNFEKASENFLIYINTKEEIELNKNKKAIEQFQIKFKTLELEKNAEVLKLDSTKFQLQSLRAQMNPHFVFNSIASISSSLKPETIENSKKLLNSFARLMRSNLDFAELEKISLEEEIQFLKDYLLLEKNRLGEKLSFEFNYSEDLDLDFIEIPSMVLQPYIENAIKHGIINSSKNGLIKISFEDKDDYLVCNIEDNGVGRKAAEKIAEKNKKHLGKSTSINAKRLRLIQNKEQDNLLVKFEDLANKNGEATGTKVILKIKTA